MSSQHFPSPTNLPANHGDDNRVDVLDPLVKHLLGHTKSVGLIVHHTALIECGDAWRLRAEKPFRELFNFAVQLCPGERFRDEPVVESRPVGSPYASCCLVHPKAVLSCAHGPERNRLDEFRVVFGYHTLEGGGVRIRIPKEDVHQIEGCFDSDHYMDHGLNVGADWALWLLKEPSQRPIARVAEPPPQAAEPASVHAIGHPYGLPMKFCLDGHVNATCIPGVFAAPLDTDDGNSGSPIFCGDEVIGVLIERQEKDTPDYARTTPAPGQPQCYKRQNYGLAGRQIECAGANGSTYTSYVVGQLCTSASCFLPALKRLQAAYP